MERVNITIGTLTFDRANYDAENDVLYLHLGEPQPGEGEETPEGHVLRYEPGTSQVIGLTVVGARETLERDGRLSITVPETIETTAEDSGTRPGCCVAEVGGSQPSLSALASRRDRLPSGLAE